MADSMRRSKIQQVFFLECLFIFGIEADRELNEEFFSVISRLVLIGLQFCPSCIPSLFLAFLDELSEELRHSTDMDSSDLSLKIFVGEFPAWNTSRLDELP